MKHSTTNSILEIASKVAKCIWLKKVLSPVWYPFKDLMQKRDNRIFKAHAKEVINKFDETITKSGYHYYLACGTLLGAIREKGFLKHDLDMDVFMWVDEWSDNIEICLKKAGFIKTHSFEVDGGRKGREETYEFKGVSIDIFYLYPAIDNYPYFCDFIAFKGCPTFRSSMQKHGGVVARRVELPMKKNFIRVEFEGIQLPVPNNYDEILTFIYGSDYMIPNPNWSRESHNSHIKIWDEYLGKYYE